VKRRNRPRSHHQPKARTFNKFKGRLNFIVALSPMPKIAILYGPKPPIVIQAAKTPRTCFAPVTMSNWRCAHGVDTERIAHRKNDGHAGTGNAAERNVLRVCFFDWFW
jgi:hypothetical protein